MPMVLTCKCGKKIKVNDDLAGRAVRCPGCQKPIRVPRSPEDEDRPDPKPMPRQTDEDHTPKKKRPARQLVGWILLGCVLLAGALVALYVFVLAPPGGPGEKAILGSWEADMEVMLAQPRGLDHAGYRIKFMEGGLVAIREAGDTWDGPLIDAMLWDWKVTSRSGQALTVVITKTGFRPREMDIEVLSADKLRLVLKAFDPSAGVSAIITVKRCKKELWAE